MPRMFIEIQDEKKDATYFLEWSTISDAPNSQVVDNLVDFEDMYYKLGYQDFSGDIQRLHEMGVSSPYYTLDELLECSDDIETREQLIEFCRLVLI